MGIKFKQMFLPHIDVLCLYTLSDIAPLYSSITQKLLQFCPEKPFLVQSSFSSLEE